MATLTVNSVFQGSGTSSASTIFAANNALFTTSSSNGDKFLNTGKEVVLFMNSSSQGGGAAITIGVTGQSADNFGGAATLHNLSTSIPSSSFGVSWAGPFAPSIYNDASGFCNITYSAGGLAVAVVSVAPRS